MGGGRQDDESEKDANEEEKPKDAIVTPVVWDPNDGAAWPRPTG